MAGKAKAPAKKAAKAPVKKVGAPVASRGAAAQVAKSAKTPAQPARQVPPKTAPAVKPSKAAGPVKATNTAKRGSADQPVAKVGPAKLPAAKPTPERPASTRAAAPRAAAAPEPVAATPMPVPKTLPPKPKPASQHDVAAAHEYLLSRSATRSEAPVIVNGKKLPSEEELLKMSEADYMNEDQLAFFRYRLQQMERELLANADETTEHLRETVIVPDPADRATIEEEHALELRTRDRERKLLKKVQQALARIDSGDYGFCEETGDPIGVPRLLARPTATLSLEAQQRREMKQKLYGD